MSQDPLHLLCIEPQFPGRLGDLANWLVKTRGYRCSFFANQVAHQSRWPSSVGQGLDLFKFNVGGVAQERAVAWTKCLERGLCYAYGAWEVLEQQRPQPIDVVLGHTAGLGSTLFASIYAPRVPIVNLFSYYYHPNRFDLADELVTRLPPEYIRWRISANAMSLLDLENNVTPWTLSEWQRSLHPIEYQSDFVVMADGVETRRFDGPAQRVGLRNRIIAGRRIDPKTRVVTFVSEVPDKLRGFDRFLALSNQILKSRRDVICVVAGGGQVHRGLDVEHFGQDYASSLLQQTPPTNPERFWMLGKIEPSQISNLMLQSDLHVYPSRAYPISRSLFEAMAAGALILAWESPPILEVLAHNENALLVSPDQPDQAVAYALEALTQVDERRSIGNAAAELARTRFDQKCCLPPFASLLESLARENPAF